MNDKDLLEISLIFAALLIIVLLGVAQHGGLSGL
jgi:hypothetical protein